MTRTLLPTLLLLSPLTLAFACGSPADPSQEEGDGDENNDAVLDSLGQSLDLDGDGYADQIDIDGDGVFDGVGVDTDFDGILDAIGLDTDGDGIIDAIDTNGDGVEDPPPSGTGGASAGTGGGASTGGGTQATGGGTGTGGETAGTGGMTSGSGVGCAGADILCETFEGIADGAIPTGGMWIAEGQSCEFQTGQFTKGVAGDQPRGASTKALKFTNKHTADCRLTANFGAHDDFWIRTYVYWDPSVSFENLETIPVDLNPAGSEADDSTAIRFGVRTKSPCTGALGGSQVTVIGWGGEVTGCDGSKPAIQGQWYCLEAHVRQSSGLQLNSYINGEAVTYASEGIAEADTITMASFSPKVDQIRLGPFSTGTMQGDLWVDDVAVATSRIGCGD